MRYQDQLSIPKGTGRPEGGQAIVPTKGLFSGVILCGKKRSYAQGADERK